MLLIKNGYIKPIVGEDIPGGCVLIGDDGKILSVAGIAASEGLPLDGRLSPSTRPRLWAFPTG